MLTEEHRGGATLMAGLLLIGTVALSAVTPARAAPAPIGLRQLPQSWRDDAAHEVRLDAFEGHRVILTMSYAECHRICPVALNQFERMQKLADARGESVDFVVVGYDPKNDRPEVWHRYREARRLERGNWHFLTGSSADTVQLARQLGFSFWNYDQHVMHQSRAVIFASSGVQCAALGEPIAHWTDAF